MHFTLNKDNTILLTACGSQAYGIYTESSDLDMIGIAIAPKNHYLGFLHNFEQTSCKDFFAEFILNENLEKEESKRLISAAKANGYEGMIYDVVKYIKLATDCNPNILDCIFASDDNVLHSNALGDKLRANKSLFISQKAKFTYSGYAFSQLKRIQTHRKWLLNPPTKRPERTEFDLPEIKILSKDNLATSMAMINKKIDKWEMDFSGMDASVIIEIMERISNTLAEMHALTREEKFHLAAKSIGFDENMTAYLMKERKFQEAERNYKQYEEWKKNRNPERHKDEEKYGYDLKHAAHLYRLLTMSKEILLDGEVNICRKNIDANVINDIRAGKWSFDKIVEWATEKEKEVSEIYNSGKSTLPKSPDREKINNLCIELIEQYHNGEK